MMFSATLHSDEVKQMAAQICQNPTLVDLRVRHIHIHACFSQGHAILIFFANYTTFCT